MIIICGLFGSYQLLILISLFCIGSYLLFRKRDFSSSRNQHKAKGSDLFYSPANGRIVDVEKGVGANQEFTLIRIAILWWNEMGLFTPVDSEVVSLIKRPGIPFYRFGESLLLDDPDKLFNSITLGLESSSGVRYDMKLVRCPFGSKAGICLETGDIAKQLANIGDFLLGGTVLLYLPKKYEILVKKGDSVTAGQTVLTNI